MSDLTLNFEFPAPLNLNFEFNALGAISYTLPIATASILGGVKEGSGVTIGIDGTISAAGTYTLPIATGAALGGIKVGTRLSIDGAGILSADIQTQDLSGYLLINSFTDASVTGKLITGFSSGAGTVEATDTILQALNKLNGNIAAKEVPLTFGSGVTRTVNAVANDLITGKSGGQTAYGGIAQTEALTLQGNIATASGTNIAGGDVYIKATPGTGTGASSIHFFTGTTLTTGSTLQTSSEKMTILGNGNVGIDLTSPTARLHLPAGTATAGTAATKWTPATSVLLTNPEIGAFEPVTDDISYTISTGTARKQLVMTDGTLLTSGRIPFAYTRGRLIDSSTLTYSASTGLALTTNLTTNMTGSGNRMVQSSAAGLLTATASIVTGKLADSATIALLIEPTNWTLTVYTGTAISGTYEGMYYCDVANVYYFYCYSDNVWIRTARV